MYICTQASIDVFMYIRAEASFVLILHNNENMDRSTGRKFRDKRYREGAIERGRVRDR